MTYVSWGVVYEGNTDQTYYDVLNRRLTEDILLCDGIRMTTIPASPAMRLDRGAIEDVARRICENGAAYHLIFIHADTGGRALQVGVEQQGQLYRDALAQFCGWPPRRCIMISPKHETEAWVLADPSAVAAALGYSGDVKKIGLPPDAAAAERLIDPKQVLVAAVTQMRGRRKPFIPEQLFPAIALRQDFNRLRESASFRKFEGEVRLALADLGCIAAVN